MIKVGNVALGSLIGLIARSRRGLRKSAVAIGPGGNGVYHKTDTGAKTLLAADAAARVCLIEVEVTTTFASSGSATPAAVAITSSSIANPSVITTAAPHGLTSTNTVVIAGHTGSTPTVNGSRVVTVTGATTFTIPVNVTTGGTGGTVQGPNVAGVQPIFAIGEAASTSKFNSGSAFTDAPIGKVFRFAGTLSATKALLVTATPATGTGTGSIAVSAVVPLAVE